MATYEYYIPFAVSGAGRYGVYRSERPLNVVAGDLRENAETMRRIKEAMLPSARSWERTYGRTGPDTIDDITIVNGAQLLRIC